MGGGGRGLEEGVGIGSSFLLSQKIHDLGSQVQL